MFDALGEKFEGIFQRIRGERELNEENIQSAMREVRMALLEADVNFKVVKDFIAAVREKALGTQVTRSVRAGQMFVKIVHDELVEMMGGQTAQFELQKGSFNRVLLLGLQGSGKTTFSGKLALRMKKEGYSPLLVGCDIYRPAAIDQLKVVGRNIDVPVFEMGVDHPAELVAQRGLEKAKALGCNLVIIDTAGRLHIDEVKMDELHAIKKTVNPTYSFFVADAMTGQDAVNSATHFNDGIGIDGVCLTKLDGDARGGAALSIRAVTGKPIYFVGLGEKSDDLAPFHPDRMASRILGMGDVLTLVEKAQEHVDQKEAEELQKKMKKEQFSLQDFMDQMQKVKKMGSLRGLMKMIPGMGQVMRGLEDQLDDDAFKPMEAMIQSMTPWERDNPDAIDGSRRKRIARGAGRDVSELNQLLKEFQAMRKMMSQMLNMGGLGGMMRGMMGGGGGGEAGGMGVPRMPMRPGGAMNQKRGTGGALAEKMKPKHRRKRKDKKKH